ncbi:Tubulin-folding cofactor D [Astathelohania contejeani]|uniref:Tubulin-folding cofactor D n=1 Tax=Astathelohania contejeani TaxID=164912 RepID=A0ABQ7HZF9_9MICR|nr:Tubulin-folding cofactor D [Thelohania contejeani]
MLRSNNVQKTDIQYLKTIINQIKISPSESIENSMLSECLYFLLANPFNLEAYLGSDFLILVDFLMRCIKKTNNKLAYKNLAMLAKNIMISTGKMAYEIKEGMYVLFDTTVNQTTFYTFLKEFSKIGNINFNDTINEDLMISDVDSSLIKRFKYKILSFQALKKQYPADKALSLFLCALIEENIKISWTLCKSIIRISGFVDDMFISNLIKPLNEITGNEGLWINTATILALLTLKGKSVHNFDTILEKMLCYDEQSSVKAAQLRETALFYLWCQVRMDKNISENMFYLIVSVVICDHSFSCRRAANTVLFEFVGRKQTKTGKELIQQINKYKRMEDIEITELMHDKDEIIKKRIFNNLFHYIEKIRLLSAKQYCFFNDAQQFDAMNEEHFFSIINFIGACYSQKKKPNGIEKLFKVLDTKLTDKIFKDVYFNLEFYVLANIYKFQEINNTSYDIQIDENMLNHNILFILNKNPMKRKEDTNILDLISLVVKNNPPLKEKPFDFKNFSSNLFFNLKKNESYVLANTKQLNLKLVKKEYISNLETNRHVAMTIRALTILQSDGIDKYIMKGLENYQVDFTGDVGYFIRKEALRYCIIKKIELGKRYLIRYLVDKSKALREEAFEYFKNVGDDVNLNFKKKFIEEYENMIKENILGNEKIYFRACFMGIRLLTPEQRMEFVIGCLSTAINCDGSLFRYLMELIREEEKMFFESVLNLLSEGRNRILLISLCFLARIADRINGAYFKFVLNDNLIRNIQENSKSIRIKALCNKILSRESI